MLDLEQLRSFVILTKELHFGRAARRLNISQPPLSRRIQALESYLGVELFERDKRSVKLTSAGRAFYPDAMALLQSSEAAVHRARQANDVLSGRIAVGFIGSTTYGFLPRLVERARRELPQIDIVLRELTSREQVENLAFSRIDLGLIRPMHGMPDLCSRRVQVEPLMIALPIGHPLAPRRRIELRSLNDQPFIGYSEESPYMQERVTRALEAQGVQPVIVQRLGRAQAILSLVGIGMGAAIVPEDTRLACFDNVVFRKIEQPSHIDVELHAIWRDGADNSVLERILQLIPQV
jgi:DNA-binding transcriptional LysR family regulator